MIRDEPEIPVDDLIRGEVAALEEKVRSLGKLLDPGAIDGVAADRYYLYREKVSAERWDNLYSGPSSIPEVCPRTETYLIS